jgi:hypothetical protein
LKTIYLFYSKINSMQGYNRMKIILLLGCVHLSITVLSQEADLSRLAKLVLELESNTQWAAVTEAWKTARGGWVAGMQKTPAPVAQGLLQFESNLVATGMEPAWAGRKPTWRKACNEAGLLTEKLAPLLLELESNLLWASVTDGWAARRDGWITECNALINADKTSKTKPVPVTTPTVTNPAVPGKLPAYCTELQKLITDINTNGLKTWASAGKTATLWGITSKPLKTSLGLTPSVNFTLATQNGTKGNSLQTTYEKYKQQLTNCLTGYNLRSMTLYTDLVNGNNETWEKDGHQVSLMFSIDSDVNGEHYLYLQVYEKKK